MTATTEGFKDRPPKVANTVEAFYFRCGLKIQPTVNEHQVAFTWRDTLYLLPFSKTVYQKTIHLLTQTQSDWAVLRSLLEMATPVSLTIQRRLAP